MIILQLFVCVTAKVKDYDYYGAYDTKRNVNYKYNELLGREYTFDFPPHHDTVRQQVGSLGKGHGDVFHSTSLFLLCLQIKSECLACRHGVAVFDMSYFGKFYLTGPDAKEAADWLFTADVNKKPGEWDAADRCMTAPHAPWMVKGRESNTPLRFSETVPNLPADRYAPPPPTSSHVDCGKECVDRKEPERCGQRLALNQPVKFQTCEFKARYLLDTDTGPLLPHSRSITITVLFY